MKSITRRDFLKTSAVAIGSSALTQPITAKAKEKVEDILATHKVSVPLTEEQNNEIDKILNEAKRYYKKLGLI